MLTRKELKLIATHIAGRLMAREIKLGANLDHETNEDKLKRIDLSLLELIAFLDRQLPSLLPKDMQELLAAADKVGKMN